MAAIFAAPTSLRQAAFYRKAGDIITVKATDDFRIEAVAIQVFAPNGTLLEKGNAECHTCKPCMWKYKTRVANKNFEGSTIRGNSIGHAREQDGDDPKLAEKIER